MSGERIVATYELRSSTGMVEAARVLAGEQSTGTFVALPDESDAIKDQFGSRVESIQPLDGSPGAGSEHALVTVSLAPGFVNGDLTTLLAALCGNVFELAQVSAIRLVSLDLPDGLVDGCPRPQYGVTGTRRLLDATDRPLFGAVARPGSGADVTDGIDQVRDAFDGGMDFVKDDEVVADHGIDHFAARVRAVMRMVEEHTQRTGRPAVYAFNITGAYDTIRRRADIVAAAGGRAIQLNLEHVGLSAVASLRKNTSLLIHGHRAGWAPFNRDPAFGIGFGAWAQLWRLAGADHIVVPGRGTRYWETDEDVATAVRDCLTPIRPAHSTDDRALPAIGGAQNASKVSPTVAATGTVDWLMLAGGAVFTYPDGPRAGACAFRDAWSHDGGND